MREGSCAHWPRVRRSRVRQWRLLACRPTHVVMRMRHDMHVDLVVSCILREQRLVGVYFLPGREVARVGGGRASAALHCAVTSGGHR